MPSLWRRFRYRRFDEDLKEELEFHRRMTQEALGDAEAAERAMGNQTLAREEARGVWIAPWLESLWQDFRYALRSLRQHPGFTLAAVGALAIAIGVNTSFFTVFNAVAIRPWPVADPARVVTVFSASASGRPGGFPIAEFRYLREHARSVAGMAAYRTTSVRFDAEAGAKPSNAQYVSANFFDVLGVVMALGRGFRADEDVAEAPANVAVLSFETWRSRFGADPAIVGKDIRIENLPFTVVGVTGEEFTGVTAGRVAVYLPLAAMRLLPRDKTHSLAFLRNPGHCCSSVTARLAPGATREDARAELEVLSRQFRNAAGLEARSVLVGGTQLFFAPGAKREMHAGFGLLYLGVTLLLLLACANVGNLFLARAAARSREFAIRGSLGAGRGRLIRQLLTEGLVVAVAAVGPGLAVAYWLPTALIRAMTDDLPSLRLKPDVTVLCYALLLAAASTLLFALTPALTSTRGDLHSSLKSGGAGTGTRFRLRMVLLGVQTATSVVLLVAAGLMLRGVERLASVHPGYAVDEVISIEIELPAEMYSEERVRPLAEALMREIATLPDAALSLNPPLSNTRHMVGVQIPGVTREGERESIQFFEVTPRFFEVMRIPVLLGRAFTQADPADYGVVVNESMARQYWPNENPVGKVIDTGTSHTVLGVVRDAQISSLGQFAPAFYRLFPGRSVPSILVRQTPQAIEQAKAAALRVEPRAELRVVPLRERFERQIQPMRIGAGIAGALSVLGLVLASMGVFGVCAFLVHQRRREIGVRIACGARPLDVAVYVLGANGRAAAIGLAAGVVISAGVSRVLEGVLYGVSPVDPVAYLGVCAVLVVAGVMATAVPAWRAVRTDPATVLRCE